MWPFSPRRDADTVATLSRRVEALETDRKTLRIEWDDVLDRLERLAGRLAKRTQRESAVLTGPERQDGAAPAPPSSVEEQVRRRRMG